MSCTTILVGKKASYNGSTMIARNDDSGAGNFTPKKFVVKKPEEGKTEYESVLSHCKIEIPAKGYKYTAVPNALKGEGNWDAGGINEHDVAMTATETIAVNERVLGADPMVEAKGWTDEEKEEGVTKISGGIGEEDLVTLILPYIKTAREGVIRLGELLEKYGTYESNGIAFSDKNEIWWAETIGGHHFIARRVPDECYVVMPNQQGIDDFDLEDAFGVQKEFICSKDLKEFISENHLNLFNEIFDLPEDYVFDPEDDPFVSGEMINARLVFGTHDDADHVYNTPRAWYMLRYFNPNTFDWDGPDAEFRPDSDDLPWCLTPEKKITSEDVKYILSSHFQGTPFDPYLSHGNKEMAGAFRSIGINRTDFMGFAEIRGDLPKAYRSIFWLAFASNAFNVMIPQYTNIDKTPDYLSTTEKDVSTESFYWTSRLIAAMADASFSKSQNSIERYHNAVQSKAREIMNRHEKAFAAGSEKATKKNLESVNQELADMLKDEAEKTLKTVLNNTSNQMRNQYARSDI